MTPAENTWVVGQKSPAMAREAQNELKAPGPALREDHIDVATTAISLQKQHDMTPKTRTAATSTTGPTTMPPSTAEISSPGSVTLLSPLEAWARSPSRRTALG